MGARHVAPATNEVDVSETASISSSIAGRYALALFELAKEQSAIDALANDTETLSAALQSSDDLQSLISSPVYSRDEQGNAVTALSGPLGLSALMANTLGLMAANRRLFALPQLLSALRQRIADERGQMVAEVTSAVELNDDQRWRLGEMLGKRFGKDIQLNTTVDSSLIGGLIVKVGSKMIDTSIRAKLANLQNAMKEVG